MPQTLSPSSPCALVAPLRQVSPQTTLVLEVDLAAITRNYQITQAFVGSNCEVAGVLKANAYGLGMVPIAQALWTAGCRRFFVAYIDEALKLRETLPEAFIAVLSGVIPDTEDIFQHYCLTPVLVDKDQVQRWQRQAVRANQPFTALLHIDTGMSRNGLSLKEAETLAHSPNFLQGLTIAYIISHLTSSEEQENPANDQQWEKFNAIRKLFPRSKASFSNSSGLSHDSRYHFDLVRPGIGLLGYARPYIPHFDPHPSARALSRVVQIQQLSLGQTVGYNTSYRCERPTRVATLGVGYRDGFFWSLSNRGVVWFGDYPAPVIGRVSMDFTLVDITDIPESEITVGSWALLFDTFEKLDKLARQAGTFHYELLTSLGSRYDRQYLNGKDHSV